MTDLYDDVKTWDLICSGNCIGGFQIESQLLRTWCRKFQPRSIQELSLVISAVRPGVLGAKSEDGRSQTQVLRDRKLGIEPVTYLHPALERSLKDTYGILVLQESLAKTAVDIAGFNPKEADELRSSVSKKVASEVSRIKKTFVDKAESFGVVDREMATKIYESMEASARYLFCQAHAVAYAIIAYKTMYMKANHPKSFFRAWLEDAKNDPYTYEKIAIRVEDAKFFDIDVIPPCVINSKDDFSVQDGKIWFGLRNIRNVGDAQVQYLRQDIKRIEETLKKPFKDISWREFVVFSDLSNGTIINLVNAGAFRHFGNRRKQMAFQVKNFLITDTQLPWLREHFYEYPDIISLIDAAARTKKEGGTCHDKRGVSKLKSIVDIYRNPPIDMKDYPDEIADLEQELLGIALTCSKLDKFNNDIADTTVKEFLRGKKSSCMTFAIEIRDVRPYTTKNETQMAFCKVADQTGTMDLVAFSSQYEQMIEDDLCYIGAKLLIAAKPSDKNDGSLILERCKELTKN